MATFHIPFGVSVQGWEPAQREPLYLEQARAAAREAEAEQHLTLSLPPELARTVVAAAAREGVSPHAWLVRAVARTAYAVETAQG
jgi:predicted HicB family RNase H-like nuclease